MPTIAEAGVPGYEAANWWGIVAPAGTPPPIVARLHKETRRGPGPPEIQKQFAKEGAEVVQMSSAEFGKFIVSGNGQMGAGREGGRDQGGVAARAGRDLAHASSSGSA